MKPVQSLTHTKKIATSLKLCNLGHSYCTVALRVEVVQDIVHYTVKIKLVSHQSVMAFDLFEYESFF